MHQQWDWAGAETVTARLLWRVSLGAWTPIGAEQTATGYEVAWKVRAPISIRSGTPTATATTSRISIGAVSGTSTALESLETSFHQDLNGDGVVFTSGSGSVVGAGNLLIGAGASVELTGAIFGNDLVRIRKRYCSRSITQRTSAAISPGSLRPET